jgi:eukaryotic-like serine/threonine-protein kinase
MSVGRSVLAGRYRLRELLSTTAMAEVRAATDLMLDRPVVVKLLAPDADRPRFEREARAAAALAHPNIVQLFDYGDEEGRPYMVFEYLPAGSLEQRLADGQPLPDEEAARIAAEIAAGLRHAHERGVVHRDLKPANVLFDAEGRAKIADFGIAHVRGADTITDAGTVLGTAAYISPEQAAGEAATPASDVYSFGVVLYRMLSGRLPFEAESAVELAAMHRTADPPPLTSIRADVPASLAAVAMAALAKRPDARPPDGRALGGALASGGPAVVGTDTQTRVIRPSPGRARRRPPPLVAGLALVLLTVAGVVAAVLLADRHESAPAVPFQPSQLHSRRLRASTAATTRRAPSSTSSAETATTARPTARPTTVATQPTHPKTTAATRPPTTRETTIPETTPSTPTTTPSTAEEPPTSTGP